MAYQSKYTGLQIDNILDSVEWKQSKIEDLASIRAGAQKGATALQSYTEKYTGTVTGIKINGVVKSGSGIIDLGTISTDISGKQDALVDGVNIATINGQSLTKGGNITINGGEGSLDSEVVSSTEASKEFPQVLYTEQTLTDVQKEQARMNIGAASTEELQRMYNELLSLIQGGVVTPSYTILDQAVLDKTVLS